MTRVPSDALVFLGATGDLAYKKVFPALQRLIRHGRLDVPVIGVAKAGWGLEQLRERARESVTKHGGLDRDAFAKLSELLRYVDGDYADPRTFEALRRERETDADLGVASDAGQAGEAVAAGGNQHEQAGADDQGAADGRGDAGQLAP